MKSICSASIACILPVLCSAMLVRSPVEKVVTLLTELKERITEDGKQEQQVYDKYACWCETTTSKKAASITKAKDDLRALGQDILSLKGKEATLSAEIAQLLADIKANEEAQATATAIRQKENAAYLAESAEMQQALAALEQAIFVLKDATAASSASLVQQGIRGSNSEAVKHLRAVVAALPAAVASSTPLKHDQLTLLRRAASGARTEYAPQSATIQGILQDMYKTFTTDLESATSTESTKNRDFESLIATKQQELIDMQDLVQKKQTEKAEAEQMLSEALQAYDDTEQQMNADVEFFDATKEACSAKSDEWKTRSALRAEELEGITKALEILSTDEARELFGKAIKPGMATPAVLLQVGAAVESSAAPTKRSAYEALKTHASRSHSLRLAKLAATLSVAEVGHFDKVIEAIDTMISTLKTEDKDDIAKRDECIEEYKNINSTVGDVTWKIEVNKAKIEKLESLIQTAETEKTDTITSISDLEVEIQSMKDQRIAENQEFLQAKKEDEDTIALLTEAKDVLSAYYVNHNVTLGNIQFIQQGPVFEVSEDQAPDATFSDKGHRKGESKGIISILTMLIEDLGNEIKVLQQDEESAQLAFEAALKAANTLKDTLTDKKINLEGVIADKTTSKQEEGVTLTENEGTLKTTEDYRTKITPDCDWIIGTFEKRASKRADEMAGLVQAKEFLAGYQKTTEESELVQRGPATVSQRSRPRAVA